MDVPDSEFCEPNRLQVLRDTGLLDQPAEEAFDRLTRMAARVLDVPIVLLSLVDKDRQFFKSQVGLPPDLATQRQTPLSHSFCKHVVHSAEPLVVEDARLHAVLKDNPVIGHGVVAYAGIPLITENGLVLGSFCAIDTKPCKWTDQQISDLKDFAAAVMTEINLRRSNDAKDRFMAMLSHELRTPLSPVLMTVSAWESDASMPANLREDARLVRRNITVQTHMIDALLDVTRINSGKLHLNKQPADVHALLRNAVEICQVHATEKSLRIHLDLQSSRCFSDCDGGKILQVFCNLLSNAIKFTNPGGQITIGSADDGEDLKISVVDTGVGVPAEVLPLVFDSFQQGGQEVTRTFGGLGLGLAICRGIVEAHAGRINAQSAGKDKGTTMTVTLPATPAPVTNQKQIAPPPPAISQRISILLVEDHEDTLRIMSRLLRKTDHNVVTAVSVATALQAASAQHFDLLISDVGLPDGTGLELLQQLGQHRPVHGIALTGYGMEEDIQRTKNAGFQKHLTKPINFAELHAAIDEIAKRKNAPV